MGNGEGFGASKRTPARDDGTPPMHGQLPPQRRHNDEEESIIPKPKWPSEGRLENCFCTGKKDRAGTPRVGLIFGLHKHTDTANDPQLRICTPQTQGCRKCNGVHSSSGTIAIAKMDDWCNRCCNSSQTCGHMTQDDEGFSFSMHQGLVV